MIKVLIADDQALLRKSLEQIISIDKEISVVGSVTNGIEAVESTRRLKPDVVMLDIEMPEMNGIQALKLIKSMDIEVKVIILTTFDNQENIYQSFNLDADGYITKDISPEELIATIKCINYGLSVIHKNVKDLMVKMLAKSIKTSYSDALNSKFTLLSDEELEIVRLIVDGMSNRDIGEKLAFTEGTIKNKVSKIYEKLDIGDRLQLAVFALENGIV